MDMLNFFNNQQKAPKIETTLENLLKEETWARFFSLNESEVKKVPQQLHTLWTSKDSDEVLKALQQLVDMLASTLQQVAEAGDEDQTDADSEILLVELLIQIIKFCFPILKNGDALHKGKLFKTLMKLANDFEIPSDDPWCGPPSPLKALNKASDFLDELLASAKDDLGMLQCCAMVAIRQGMASSTDNDLMAKLLQPLITITDDATRACFVYSAANLAKESFFVNDEKKKQLADICKNFLALPDVSLTKLMAALVTARSETNNAPAEVLHILADYLVNIEAYESVFSTTPLGNVMDLSYVTPNFVSTLNPACDIFFARVLANIKALNAKPEEVPDEIATSVLLAWNYGMKEPILPGMKVIDLRPLSVTLLNTLVELDRVWTNEKIVNFFSKVGIPSTKEALVAFLADNADDGTKRFPKFEGIDEIPWDKLGHAYGEATDVPDCLRMLASVNKRKRDQAQHALYGNIYHQGTTYSATPYAVPYLIEMLECTMVQNKAHILVYCVNLLASFTEGFFSKKTGFDVNVEYPLNQAAANNEQNDENENGEDNGGEDHYCAIKHKIEQNLVNGLPVFLNLLQDPTPKIRGCTAFVLAFLPRVADRSVPKIKDQLQSETDSSVKASLMLSLGMLLPRVSSHEECLQFFNGQWGSVKDSDDETVKFSVAACAGRLLIGQKPPKFVLDQLLKAVGQEDSTIDYHAFDRPSTLAMDLITLLKADDALTHIIQQFKNTSKMFEVLPVLRAMLSIAFRFELENDKPIQPATLKPEQIEVLQAIVDHGDELVWTFGNATMMLRDEFNLPGNKQQLVEFIEKAKASKDVMEM